jgi:hypothetical protein
MEVDEVDCGVLRPDRRIRIDGRHPLHQTIQVSFEYGGDSLSNGSLTSLVPG